MFGHAKELARRISIAEIFRSYLGITTEFLLTTVFLFENVRYHFVIVTVVL